MHFSVVGSTSKAKCSYCLNNISFSGGATGNLLRHLITKHPTVVIQKASYRQVEDTTRNEQQLLPSTSSQLMTVTETPTSLLASIPSTSAVSNSSANPRIPSTSAMPIPGTSAMSSTSTQNGNNLNPKQSDIGNFITIKKPISLNKAKAFHDQLMTLIVKAYLPLNIVENPEFKKLEHMLNPNYELPSRKTISANYIPQLYTRVKDNVQNVLHDAVVVGSTTDGWTSLTNQSYIAITAHFIDKHADLQSYLLGCFPYDSRSTHVP